MRFVGFVQIELANTDLLIDGKPFPLAFALELGEQHCVIVAQCAYPEGSNLEDQLRPLRRAERILIEVREPCSSTNPNGGSVQLRRSYVQVKLVSELFESHLWPTREVPARRVWACRMCFEVQS